MLWTMLDQLWFLVWLALRRLLPDILEHRKIYRYFSKALKCVKLFIKRAPDLELILWLRLKATPDCELPQALRAEGMATRNAQGFLLFSVVLTEADGAGEKLIFAVALLTLPLTSLLISPLLPSSMHALPRPIGTLIPRRLITTSLPQHLLPLYLLHHNIHLIPRLRLIPRDLLNHRIHCGARMLQHLRHRVFLLLLFDEGGVGE